MNENGSLHLSNSIPFLLCAFQYSNWRLWVSRVGSDYLFGVVSRHEVRKALASHFREDEARFKQVELWLEGRNYSLTALEYSALLLRRNVTAALLRSRSCIEGVMTEEAWEWGQQLPRSYFIWLVFGIVGSFSSAPGSICGTCGEVGFKFRCKSNSCPPICQSCLWRNVMKEDGNELTCPNCCGRSEDEFICDEGPVIVPLSSENAAQSTMERFNALPYQRMGGTKKGKGKKRMAIFKTRKEGNSLFNGETQTKRSERMWETVRGRDCHRLGVLVDLGINVDDLDDDGRTPVYTAVARGWKLGVNVLLKAGADATKKDRFGAGLRVANRVEQNCPEIDLLLAEAGCEEQKGLEIEYQRLGSITTRPLVISLAPNALIIDEIISSQLIDRILADTKNIPKAKQREKSIATCSVRKYAYDHSGILRTLLSREITKAFDMEQSLSQSRSQVVVLPGLRFLDYDLEGSSLPVHVDLAKVHPVTGKSSSHTILLYLSDYNDGGETTLLRTVQGGDVLENELCRVKVRRSDFQFHPPFRASLISLIAVC